MFERLQKPFLTVDTGEAYQPIRLIYDIRNLDTLVKKLHGLACLENKGKHSWHWFWRNECDDIHFESLESFKRVADKPIRLGTLLIRDNKLYINLPSFKRACLGAPFFHRQLTMDTVKPGKADFLNKVFGLSERLPHGFSELFEDELLDRIVHQRIDEYEAVQKRCEEASSAEEAFAILSEYTKGESKKSLPYAERYSFHDFDDSNTDPDVLYLGFYIFLRSRELVAIRRWFGESGYTLQDAAEDTIEKVFGGMNIDIIE